MDLFDDIPEPVESGNNRSEEKSKVAAPTPSLVRGYSRANQCFTSKGIDLFDDLPSPSVDIVNAKSNGASEHAHTNLKRKANEESDNEKTKKVQPESLFQLFGHVSERKGEREEMQDAHTLHNNFQRNLHINLHPSVLRLAMYAVYDGHGGCRASRYMSSHFPVAVAASFPKGDMQTVEREMKRFLTERFKRVDEDFLREAARHKPSWKDGTTAIVVLVINNILYISNLGDSKAILCRYCPESKKYNAILLSKDHSPTDYNERMRIQKAGGSIKDGRVVGILEVSRSIGDGQFKRCGVTCVPDIRRCQITENDRFLILACDGLWKVFTSEEVICIINKYLQDESLEATDEKTAEEVRCEVACSNLSSEAVRKLSGDNVTVLLVRILPCSNQV